MPLVLRRHLQFTAAAAAALAIVATLTQATLAAEPLAYHYGSIDVAMQVQPNSSVDVSERQMFVFDSDYRNFHRAWRVIPRKGVGAIENIVVRDDITGQPLRYSARRLSKDDPASWGAYTAFSSRGSWTIEWYYAAPGPSASWSIDYTLRGSIAFGRQRDRLYWNLFTDYEVPVSRVTASLRLPSSAGLQATAYRGSARPFTSNVSEGRTATWAANDFAPHEAFTVDAAWAHGVAQQSAYWRWWLGRYYGTVGGVALVLATLVFCAVARWRRERPQKQRTVVAEYEPPPGGRPLLAQLVLTERTSARGLAATAVDLAVRGYLKITPVVPPKQKSAWGVIVVGFMVFMALAIIGLLVNGASGSIVAAGVAFVLIMVPAMAMPLLGREIGRRAGTVRDFTFDLLRSSDASLLPYEQSYLEALFGGERTFSTAELKKSQERRRSVYMAMLAVRDQATREIDRQPNVFATKVSRRRVQLSATAAAGILAALTLAYSALLPSSLTLAVSIACCTLGAWAYLRFEPRLSESGHRLYEQWLGFKLFLSVAERYRLQNLTPDQFQRFLPYAIVFGVEKQWATAFRDLHVEPPQWYSAPVGATGSPNGASAAGFSPAAFSASFSSSFSSLLSAPRSSSGGGGGFGGGGAGGGGGGGGGGAG